MKKETLIAILVFLCLCCIIYGHAAVALAGCDEASQIRATNAYMAMDAMAWVIAFAVIWMMTSGTLHRVMSVVTFLSFGKVVDEIFFNPTVFMWNDLLTFNIAAVIIVFIIIKSFRP